MPRSNAIPTTRPVGLRTPTPRRTKKRARLDPQAQHTSSLALWFEALDRFPPLSREEETATARKALSGDPEARDKLIQHNLRFAVTRAKRFATPHVPLEDLIQAANTGLLEALPTFDPDRGTAFITYAVYWIDRRLRSEIYRRNLPVTITEERAQQLQELIRYESDFVKAHGQAPQLADCTRALGISKDIARSLRRLRFQLLDLDAESSPHNSNTLHDVVRVDSDPEEELALGERSRILTRELADLNERDLWVLYQHYGVNTRVPKSFREIGEMLGITHERVRQLIDRAKLKASQKQTLAQLHAEL